MIQIAFYKATGTPVDRAIRLATGSRYSHAELLGRRDGDGRRCISASKRDGGRVRIKTIRLEPSAWDVIELPGDQDAAWQRATTYLGSKYDAIGATLSIMAPILGRQWRKCHPETRFCSELLAEAMQLPDPWSLHPGELYDALTARGS